MNDMFDISQELSIGDKTEIVFNEICYSEPIYPDKADDILSEIKIGFELNDRPIFLEGLVERLNNLGFECSIDDANEIKQEIKKRLKALGLSSDEMKPIINWISGTTPSTKNRENNYTLCYALEMDESETSTFFTKHFLSIPYNYKNATDAIFYYCLSHKRPYSTIKDMLEKSNDFPRSSISNTQTIMIGRHIRDIDNDDDFMQYLKQHCYNDTAQYQHAREEIKAMYESIENNEYVIRYEELNSDGIEYPVNVPAQGPSRVHEFLFGFNYQKAQKSNTMLKILPKRFIELLPSDGDLKKIIDGKPTTYETLRKSLIIFSLFDYYVNIHNFFKDGLPEDEIQELLDDFLAETNAKLADCGFSQIYLRHPFDAIICLCANSSDPIDTFRLINLKRHAEE